jgi:hypothetical protein
VRRPDLPDQTGNGWDATLVGGATMVQGVTGNAVRLSGDGQSAALPTGILWNRYDFSLAVWVLLDSPGAGQHLFDFATGPTRNMYLTPLGATGVVRFAITTNGPNAEQRIDGTAPLPVAEWVHVALTKSPLVGTLWVNGVQLGQNPNVGLYPARLGNTANNWIGRSQNAPNLTSVGWSTISAAANQALPRPRSTNWSRLPRAASSVGSAGRASRPRRRARADPRPGPSSSAPPTTPCTLPLTCGGLATSQNRQRRCLSATSRVSQWEPDSGPVEQRSQRRST